MPCCGLLVLKRADYGSFSGKNGDNWWKKWAVLEPDFPVLHPFLWAILHVLCLL